jgi:hypothetical protein
MVNFFPMNEYQSCLPGQKLNIVSRINTWSAAHRSLLITGFIDNDDDIPMVFNAEKYPDEPLTKIGVTEFLGSKIKAGDGKNLFCKVYPPFQGTREVECELHQFAQAHSYVKVAHGELTRNMDEEAMMLVFAEPDNAVIMARSDELWEPHYRATTIENMPIKEKEKFQTKRSRNGQTEINPAENKTVTTGGWPTLPTCITTDGTKEKQTVSIMTSNNGNTGIAIQEFEAYKQETVKRINELQNAINGTTKATNNNSESLKNMDERIKNISRAVINVDDRMVKVEKAIDSNTASSNENYNNMMQAMTNFSGQMEKNNQAIAYLLLVVNPTMNQPISAQTEQHPTQTPTTFLSGLFGKATNNQNNNEHHQDQTMYEQHGSINGTNDEHYTRNIDKEDYRSGSMMSQTYHS